MRHVKFQVEFSLDSKITLTEPYRAKVTFTGPDYLRDAVRVRAVSGTSWDDLKNKITILVAGTLSQYRKEMEAYFAEEQEKAYWESELTKKPEDYEKTIELLPLG